MAHRHILLIDDEADIREVAGMSLGAIGGWRVSSASGGEEGIAKALAEKPDVILCDVMMPDIDGPATVKRLRESSETREIPVILLTARVQRADRVRFAQLGVAGVLPKPFDPMVLSDQVDALLASQPPGASGKQ
jgi:two-component system alkaline phosphatase synthesis response regulator PhoP